MFSFAKKGLYVGLGIASMTKDKVESFAQEFSNKAKLSEDEGRKFADYLHEESQKATESLKTTVEKIVGKATEKLPCTVHANKISQLEARLKKLEEKLGIEKEETTTDCNAEKCANCAGDDKGDEQ